MVFLYWRSQGLTTIIHATHPFMFLHKCIQYKVKFTLRISKCRRMRAKSHIDESYRPARLDLHDSGLALKTTSTAIGFWFFNFSSEYLKRLQSSEPASYKNGSILVLVRITFRIESFLPIGWGTFIFLKKTAKGAALFWYGFGDVGILQLFYSRAVIQWTIVELYIWANSRAYFLLLYFKNV